MKNSGIEKNAASTIAELMCAAARTAPKARGRDNLLYAIITEDTEKEQIAKVMEQIAAEEPNRVKVMTRDAQGIRKCMALLLFGTKFAYYDLNCSFCGWPTCEQAKQHRAQCIYAAHDLGLAIGSACAIAGVHHIDNRVMYSVGYAARKMKLLGDDAGIIFGIPLSITGKNIFFDRA
ncbi:MAG: DUF2148 domain-containing protein [Elusimicrobiota bacterium]